MVAKALKGTISDLTWIEMLLEERAPEWGPFFILYFQVSHLKPSLNGYSEHRWRGPENE
jgi:hypothetical protein